MYLDHYGGDMDVWIAKVLYRMNLVSNDLYLRMAKADFREYQKLSRLEWNGLRNGAKDSMENLEALIDLVSFDDASGNLREAWKQCLMAWTTKGGHGSIEGDTALLLVRTIEICSGRQLLVEHKLNHWEYSQLEQLTSSICHKLSTRVLAQNSKNTENTEDLDRQVDLEMQELSWRVHQGSHGIDRETRQTFLHVVKSFYYLGHCSPETVDSHIAKVIFQDVI